MITASGSVSRTAASPAALLRRIAGRRCRVGADRRDVHDVGRCRRPAPLRRRRAAPKAWTASKLWRPRFGEDGDEVDDRVGAVDGAIDRPAIAQIGLDRLHPADHAERLEMAGEIGPAHRGADAPAALQQRPHDMAADEPEPPKTVTSPLSASVIAMILPLSTRAPRRPPSHIGCRLRRPAGCAQPTDRKRMPDGSVRNHYEDRSGALTCVCD